MQNEKGAKMAAIKSKEQADVVAVYPDRASAEDAVRRLQSNGIEMENVSIIGTDFEAVEKPLGFVTAGSVARDGVKFGAWSGLFGLLVRGAFLILPGIGPVVVAGPLAAALRGGIEGEFPGGAFGGLTGALVGLGMSKDKAIQYESDVKEGKFLVALKSDAQQIARAKTLLSNGNSNTIEVISLVTTAA
jgi:Heat induced stress protein YflT domain